MNNLNDERYNTRIFFFGGGGEVTIPADAGFVLFGGILCLHILICMDRTKKGTLLHDKIKVKTLMQQRPYLHIKHFLVLQRARKLTEEVLNQSKIKCM